MTRTVSAYAKINLYLDIVRRRDNGYHDICGIMHKISLSDLVSVSVEASEQNRVSLTCSVPSIPTGSDNIAYRAAELYLARFSEQTYSVSVHIEKHIPAAGGLAGGSTDAAAVLSAMADMIGGCTNEQLLEAGASLGADVPFCLSQCTMITEGIGEILTPCPSLPPCTILICNTGEGVSTPAAYAKLDRIHDSFRNAVFDSERFSALTDALERKDLGKVSDGMFNIFEDAVLDECPLAKEAKHTMLRLGAVGAMMSGSGSTIFGLYDDKESAEQACRLFSELGYVARLCSAVG